MRPAVIITAFILSCGLPSVSPAVQIGMSDSNLEPRSRELDVLHYTIAVSFEEERGRVHGRTSLTLTSLVPLLDSLVLDAVEMSVRRVIREPGRTMNFRNDRTKLVLFPEEALRPGDTITVSVEYSCTPARGLYFLRPDSASPLRRRQIWTQGAEEDNRYWFPSADVPHDKATSELIATVPEELVVLSNGRLLATTHDRTSRTRTFHWSQPQPHSPYLIMLAAGEYLVVEERYKTVPLLYYVYPERAEASLRAFSKTARMMEFYERMLGMPYPWEKYAQVFIDDFMFGGMENTSATTLNTVYIIDDRAALDASAEGVVAHELVHQWWGDLVTCRDWTHLWLNEGFATYYASLFAQFDRGEDEFQYEMSLAAENVKSAEKYRGRRPIVSEDSYGENVYSKGSWVLHMLRGLLGDESFHHAMQSYLKRFRFANAETRELQLAVEDATGRDLGWFFDQWVYGAGYPRLEVQSSWDDTAGVLEVRLEQVQETDSLTGYFIFSLPISCTTPVGTVDTVILVRQRREDVRLALSQAPLMVNVNDGGAVLASFVFSKSREELIYQLKHARGIAHRIEAAKALREYPDDPPVFEALRRSALYDAFWAVRMEATVSLSVMRQEHLREALIAAYGDRHASVRNAAITGMEHLRGEEVAAFLEKAAYRDSSYFVIASCLRSMMMVDSGRAGEFALSLVDMESYRDVVRRAALGVLRGHAGRGALPAAKKYAALRYEEDIRGLALAILGDIGEHDPEARAIVLRALDDARASLRQVAVRVLTMWGGAEVRTLLERRLAQEQDQAVMHAIETALEILGKGR